MLVITGLAGTVNNTSLSNQERKFVSSQLKESRSDLLNVLKSLSESQLDYKISSQTPSIRDCFYHFVLSERKLWVGLEAAMKEPARPEKRLELKMTDDDLMNMINANANHVSEKFKAGNIKWNSMPEAASAFKSLRTQQLKYIKTTTSDLRNRFIKIPSGWVDCYQYIIYLKHNSDQHLRQINEILSHASFPRK
jgi:hypothetical protein